MTPHKKHFTALPFFETDTVDLCIFDDERRYIFDTIEGTHELIGRGKTQQRNIICSLPVLPVAMITVMGMIDGPDESTYVLVRYKNARGAVRESAIPYSVMINPQRGGKEWSDLQMSGVGLTQSQVRLFGPAMSRIIPLMQRAGMLEDLVWQGAAGWHDGTHYTPGTPGYAGPLDTVTAKRGDAKLWRDVVVKAISHSDLLGMVIATAFSGYLRDVVKGLDHNTILYLWHSLGEKGKTTAGKIAASIQSCPFKSPAYATNFIDARSTFVGIEQLCAACHDGFAVIDEFQGLLDTSTSKVADVMFFTNGGGRNTARQAQGLVFSTSIIATANKSLLEAVAGATQEQALETRVIEINLEKHPLFERFKGDVGNLIFDLDEVLSENFGWGYQPAIDYIVANRAQIIADYTARAKKLMKDVHGGNRRVKNFALILEGWEIARHVLKIPPAMYKNVVAYIETIMNEKPAIEDKNADARDAIVAFVRANLAHFAVKGCLHPSLVHGGHGGQLSQSEAADVQTAQAKARGTWGIIEQPFAMPDDVTFTGRIMINRKAAVGAAMKAGLNVESVARFARENGWLYRTESAIRDNELTITKPGYGRVYCFEMKSDDAMA
jgi:hypothetical protein